MQSSPILLVDDDDYVLDVLSMYLKNEGYEFELAHDGQEALDKVKIVCPQLIILDLMMPNVNGIEVCREIRKDSSVPIIMLTAKAEDIDKILGLELGADDYITKPFNPREVMARIKAVLRRAGERQKADDRQQDELHFKGLDINLTEYKVMVEGEFVPMTPKEIEVLWLMASNPGKVFTRDHLLKEIWGYDFYGDSRTVDTHIKKIRKKLKTEQSLAWKLTTIWGVGYKFEVE